MTPDDEWTGLWRRCVSGDAAAAERLCLKAWPLLAARFRRLTHDPERARDRTQGFLLWLFEREQHRLKSFRPELGVPLMAYLMVLAVRYHISEERLAPAKLKGLETGLGAALNLQTAGGLDARLMSRELGEAVAALPPRERAAILMRLEGLRDAEIGRLLGITAGGVAALLFRAREKLRDLLGGGWCDPRLDGPDDSAGRDGPHGPEGHGPHEKT